MGGNPHSIIGRVLPTEAVFFDVDFTLIHPGSRFQAAGYQASCARHGIQVDAALFDRAVAAAAEVLDVGDQLYDAELFVRYTARIIELMGGCSPAIDIVARELYDAWAEHDHFTLYDDAHETLHTLAARGYKLGLISNSHRCLVSFQTHFGLGDLVSVAVSSSEHGYLKPHPGIFREALARMQVPAERAAMVGDSLSHDVRGALGVGMRAILLDRRPAAGSASPDVTTIGSLRDLLTLLPPSA